MTPLRIILGVYQAVAAIVGLLVVGPQIERWGLGSAGIVFLFCALSFAAGITIIVTDRLGWKLTLINQGVQTLGVFSPLITLMGSEGIAMRLHAGILTSDTGSWLDARFTGGFFWRAGADYALAFMKHLDGFPNFALSLNLVALALSIVAWKALGKIRHKPEDTPKVSSIDETH